MTASLMVYALLAGLLVAGAGRALEELIRMVRQPVRLVWLGALGGLIALTATAPMRRPALEPKQAAAPEWLESVQPKIDQLIQPSLPSTPSRASERWSQADISSETAVRGPQRFAAAVTAEDIDRGLKSLWLLLSASVLAVGLTAHAHFSLKRRRWPRRRLDETWVRVAPRTGPAVIGVVSPEIVVPRWLEDEPVETRQLVLLHEKEHVRGRDTLTLAAGCIGVALLPWNPFAWWMLHRLRLAVEMDCDRRVLRHGIQPGQYGTMLIGLSARDSGLLPGHPALASFPSSLERRLVAMTARASDRRWYRGVGMALLAATAAMAACKAHLPPAAGVTESLQAEPAAEGTQERAGDDAGNLAVRGRAAGIARASVRSTDLAPVAVQGTASVPSALPRTDLSPLEVRGTGIARSSLPSVDLAPVAARGTVSLPAAAVRPGLTPVEVRGTGIAPSSLPSTDLTPIVARGTASVPPALPRPGLAPVEVRGTGVAPSPARSTDRAPADVRGTSTVPSGVRPAGLAPIEVRGVAIGTAGTRAAPAAPVQVRVVAGRPLAATTSPDRQVRPEVQLDSRPQTATSLNRAVTADTTVLYIVDGSPVDRDQLPNADQIESVSVLKRGPEPPIPGTPFYNSGSTVGGIVLIATKGGDYVPPPRRSLYVIDGKISTQPPSPEAVITSITVHAGAPALVERFGDSRAGGGVIEVTTEGAGAR